MSFKKKMSVLIIAISALIFTCSVLTALINVRNSLTTAAENQISNVTELAYNVINGYQQRVTRGELDLATAQKLALLDMKDFKYQGKNYVWVMDYNCKYLYHPTRPLGFDGNTLTNKKGEHYISNLLQNAINNKEIYLKDASPKPGDKSGKKYPKIMYSRAIEGWHWVVATGIYIDSIDAMTTRTFLHIFIVNIIAIILILMIINQTVITKIAESLNKITSILKHTSENVSKSASSLDYTSKALAQSSTEQAAAIQETSATIEETASMVKQNNENTLQANSLSKQPEIKLKRVCNLLKK